MLFFVADEEEPSEKKKDVSSWRCVRSRQLCASEISKACPCVKHVPSDTSGAIDATYITAQSCR